MSEMMFGSKIHTKKVINVLQIISGKFYGDGTIHNNPTKKTLFSNAYIVDEFTVSDIKIKRVEDYKSEEGIYQYSVIFDNKIEQQNGGFSIMNAWSDVVIYQLRNALTFYFDSIWDEDIEVIKRMCQVRVKKESRIEKVAANYVRTNLNLNLQIDEWSIEKGIKNIENLVALHREDYITITACIRTYCASIRLLENDPNLAYSMLIFALESLSQKYDGYEPVWNDYNEVIRGKLEKQFKNMDVAQIEEIKKILLGDAHLKLSKRFLHFVLTYLDDGFYFDDKISNKVLKDDVEEALKNAYNIRSKYAHALKLIIDQSAESDASKTCDYFRKFHVSYFTYSGLLRLSKYVIENFVSKADKVDKEKIGDWTRDLPGMITAQLAPQFWLSKIESEKCLGASKRLEGFIYELVNSNVAYDIYNVIDLYIERFDQVSEEMKRSIFALCIIWKDSVKHSEDKKEQYQQFIDKHRTRINICCIQNIVLFSFMLKDTYSIEWEEDDVEQVLLKYIKDRKKEKAFLFPNVFETIMYIFAAWLLQSDDDKRKFWIEKAKYNCTNDDKVSEIVTSEEDEQKKIADIWKYIWSNKE